MQFRGDNTPAGFAEVTEADLDKLNVTPAATQIFGMAVTQKTA
ncbi:hypothetical protein [Methylocucumis oryzae]|nr:hypothetical protein [Methylocucumis oryzae]